VKLSAPKNLTWWISLVLGALGLIGGLVSIPVLSALSMWLLVIGLALLLVATAISGL
jgi:hypothetical protein